MIYYRYFILLIILINSTACNSIPKKGSKTAASIGIGSHRGHKQSEVSSAQRRQYERQREMELIDIKSKIGTLESLSLEKNFSQPSSKEKNKPAHIQKIEENKNLRKENIIIKSQINKKYKKLNENINTIIKNNAIIKNKHPKKSSKKILDTNNPVE